MTLLSASMRRPGAVQYVDMRDAPSCRDETGELACLVPSPSVVRAPVPVDRPERPVGRAAPERTLGTMALVGALLVGLAVASLGAAGAFAGVGAAVTLANRAPAEAVLPPLTRVPPRAPSY